MKALLALVFVLFVLQNAAADAQEVRLDSLWAKFGGVTAMSFSPDSKRLVIGEDGSEGQIRIFDAQTGSQIDSIAHSFYVDLAFTPNGQNLLVIDQTGIQFFNAATYKYERSISYDQGGIIAFSPDESILALAGSSWIAVVDIQKGEVLAKLSRPSSYVPDPKHPMTTEPYWNGKVSFSLDGTYIIGKYENSLVRWDWKNAPTKPEIVIGDFGNRAVIGFSPNKKYLVQQSNYIWDLEQKKQLEIEGLTGYESSTATGFSSTQSSSCLTVIDKDHTPRFIDIASKRVITTTPLKYTMLMSISPDSNYFAYQYGNGQTHMYKINWRSTGLRELQEDLPLQIQIQTQPINSNISISISSNRQIQQCRISVLNILGTSFGEIYNGIIQNGIQSFNWNTTSLASGKYLIRVQYNDKEISQGFIITK